MLSDTADSDSIGHSGSSGQALNGQKATCGVSLTSTQKISIHDEGRLAKRLGKSKVMLTEQG
jgi:hypothetical protein